MSRAGVRKVKKKTFDIPLDSETCASCPPISKFQSLPTNRVAAASVQAKEPCSWFEVHHLVRTVAAQLEQERKNYDCILAISTGGIIPAKLMAEELEIDNIAIIPFRDKKLVESEMPVLKNNLRYLAVDDIFDTGKTFKQAYSKLEEFRCDFAFCISRYPNHPGYAGRILNHDRWIVFPWEKEIK